MAITPVTIQVRLNGTVKGGAQDETINSGTTTYTAADIGRGGSIQIIGTSEEVVGFGDIATEGVLYMTNMDEDNFVDYGPEDTGAMVALGTISPGKFAWLEVKPGVVVRAQADTAAVKLDVRLYEAEA